MIEVVEAFDQKVVGFIDVLIKARAVVQKMVSDSAFFSNLLFREEIGWFFPWLYRRLSRRVVVGHEGKISRVFVLPALRPELAAP